AGFHGTFYKTTNPIRQASAGWDFYRFRKPVGEGAASSEEGDAACAVGVLVVQQVAGVVGQGAVGAGHDGAVEQHGVAGQDQVVLGYVVLDQGGAVEHGEAVAQAAQGVVHAG